MNKTKLFITLIALLTLSLPLFLAVRVGISGKQISYNNLAFNSASSDTLRKNSAADFAVNIGEVITWNVRYSVDTPRNMYASHKVGDKIRYTITKKNITDWSTILSDTVIVRDEFYNTTTSTWEVISNEKKVCVYNASVGILFHYVGAIYPLNFTAVNISINMMFALLGFTDHSDPTSLSGTWVGWNGSTDGTTPSSARISVTLNNRGVGLRYRWYLNGTTDWRLIYERKLDEGNPYGVNAGDSITWLVTVGENASRNPYPWNVGDKFNYYINRINTTNWSSVPGDTLWAKIKYYNVTSSNWTTNSNDSKVAIYDSFIGIFLYTNTFVPTNYTAVNFTLVTFILTYGLTDFTAPSSLPGTWVGWNGSADGTTPNTIKMEYTISSSGIVVRYRYYIDNATGWYLVYERVIEEGPQIDELLLLLAASMTGGGDFWTSTSGIGIMAGLAGLGVIILILAIKKKS